MQWNYFSYRVFHVILTDKDLIYVQFGLVVVDIQNVDMNFYKWLQTYKEEKTTHFDQHIWLPQQCVNMLQRILNKVNKLKGFLFVWQIFFSFVCILMLLLNILLLIKQQVSLLSLALRFKNYL